MSIPSRTITRRKLLQLGSALAASSVAALGTSSAAAADARRLEEKDPTAQSLGYLHDATKVNKAKFPTYVAGQICANCRLYQAKKGEPWGGCAIFGAKLVNAKGWCTAYVKVAA